MLFIHNFIYFLLFTKIQNPLSFIDKEKLGIMQKKRDF